MIEDINKKKIILIFVLILLIPICAFYILKLLSVDSIYFSINSENIGNYISNYGIYAPLFFILICAFTVVFPPSPNLIPMIAGGILFGIQFGILYSYLGIMIGATINFFLTRIFGRKIMKSILNKNEINFVDKFAEKVNWRIISILPFFPGMYADLGGYSAGLSNMNFKKYFFAASLGYIILITLANIIGRIFIEDPFLRIILLIILFIGLISIFIIPLIRWLRKVL
jgi:uncharacterized membrane protein YdjX (TVP38/TMEM64 family)